MEQTLWFVAGSQHLYGQKALDEVAKNARAIAADLDQAPEIPAPVVAKGLVTTSAEITRLVAEANADTSCAGLIVWMHTFSPAKMGIRGLADLRKPLAQFHTQLNRDIPYDKIDMDYMNLHQTAHGGREFGHVAARLGIPRKVIAGHRSSERVRFRLGTWARAALAFSEQQGAKVARFGDNMRNVAVTEGDKVAAQISLGYEVHGYGVGDLVERIDAVSDAEVTAAIEEYESQYELMSSLDKGGARRAALETAARQEIGIKRFLDEGGFTAYTDTFEDLSGIDQLPGLATQRLMAAGYGFGAEGDWKTAALLRAVKTMGKGLSGGASFMEDYTYHFEPGRERVLGAHMLEVCPTIADTAGGAKPRLEIHPLSIGGKADPVRLVFDTAPGPAVNASLVDMGDRFRLVVNPVEVVKPDADFPNLPVARAVWIPEPDLESAAEAWIYAGAAHHTVFSQAVTVDMLEDYAEMCGLEFVLIDHDTKMRYFRQRLSSNQ